MSIKLVLVLLVISWMFADSFGKTITTSYEDYLGKRARLLEDESKTMFGNDLELEDLEKKANDKLMKAKCKEIDEGILDPLKFLPSKNFLTVIDEINKSQVYKMIQMIPKGANLHVHRTAMTSLDYILNITYNYPNLYICESLNDMKIKFFDKIIDNEKNCNWKLLNDVRKNDSNVDIRINKRINMTVTIDESVRETWNKFEIINSFFEPLLKYKPVWEKIFYQGLLEHYNDNIFYMEIRSGTSGLYELNGTIYDTVETAKICEKIVKKFMNDHPDFVGAKLIYAPNRKLNDTTFEKYLTIARRLKTELPDFFAGFDLVGQEEMGQPLFNFAKKLRALGDDMQLFFHAGETNWYGTSTDENLIDAVLLNTKRIGHGLALLKHPRVLDIVRENNIAIELNPISNQILKLTKDLKNHPAAVLLAKNYPIVVSNDDPALWGAKGLSHDFYEIFVGIMSRNADLRSLKKLALNSIEYSSMDEAQKTKARQIFNERWKKSMLNIIEI